MRCLRQRFRRATRASRRTLEPEQFPSAIPRLHHPICQQSNLFAGPKAEASFSVSRSRYQPQRQAIHAFQFRPIPIRCNMPSIR